MKKPIINKGLFWDTPISQLDFKKNCDFIISRVLVYGDIDDFKMIKKIYGLKKIQAAAKKVSYSQKKDLNFWSVIFNIPLREFKYFNKKLSTKSSFSSL